MKLIVVSDETVKRFNPSLLIFYHLISSFSISITAKTRFMMTERIALVTGGSRGLGKNAALKLAADGTGIILTYNSSQQEALDVVHEIQEKALTRRHYSLTSVISQFRSFCPTASGNPKTVWQRDTFDYLLNNAGTGLYAPYADTTEAQFDEAMNIHFKGPFFLTQRCRCLTTGADPQRLQRAGPFYPAGLWDLRGDEGAMEVLTRYQAKELGARGISVNIIAPGAIETDFGGGRVRDNAELNQLLASQTALGRVGLPDDIGDAIAALLSDKLGWMNAQRIEVSGGMFL
jgi:NAD(P)-dependent dehydrogenase (short-subunit alcohol dehydrogenase family)